jgi:hypothetical protein
VTSRRICRFAVLISCTVTVLHLRSYAQSTDAQPEALLPLKIGDKDRVAASNYSNFHVRLSPVHKAGLGDGSATHLLSGAAATENAPSLTGQAGSSEESLPSSTVPGVPSPGFYPADLTYLGGAIVPSAASNLIYLDDPPTEWGRPAVFLRNLFSSTFVHTIDQYIGSTAGNRYTIGISGSIPYPIFATLGDNDLLQIVHAAAAILGSGYRHIYHVFLPKGVDYCSQGACYSPDVPSTFVFCAFHGSVDFSDVGHVLFTLEPYQNVLGCSVEQPSPNGALVDSTSSVLSHEFFETITDPDPGKGWLALNSLAVLGDEIGDLCDSVDPFAPYFRSPISVLNGKSYEIPLEYSNKYHACANVP